MERTSLNSQETTQQGATGKYKHYSTRVKLETPHVCTFACVIVHVPVCTMPVDNFLTREVSLRFWLSCNHVERYI